jgi:MFS family permease
MNRLPRGVWALGLVSLFMDLSTEMAQALMPLFLTVGLGAPVLSVGLIDGMGEAITAFVKVYSGRLSDRLGRRKSLALLGYGLAALAKPAFPLAHGVALVAAGRFLDRLGKGIRGAPRDALVADLTPPAQRGAAFGLRQSLDTVGAFGGPLLALLVMWVAGDMRLVFWLACLPAFMAIGVLAFLVVEPPRGREAAVAPPLTGAVLRGLGRPFYAVVGLAVVLGAGRFGEPFLILRAQSVGLPLVWAPLALVVMNIAYAVSAYPVGRLSDRLARISHGVTNVTEAKMATEQAAGTGRCGASAKLANALCRHFRPARRVAPGRVPGSLRPLDVGPATPSGPRLPGAPRPERDHVARDREKSGLGRRRLFAIGLAILAAADAVLALADRPVMALLGAALWGLHMGFTQGLLAALTADVAPSTQRGTAFGLVSLLHGAALLAGGAAAGLLWDAVGPAVTYWVAMAVTVPAVVLVSVMRGRPASGPPSPP